MPASRQQVCVIGDGVGALAAAHQLAKHGALTHEVTLVTSIPDTPAGHGATGEAAAHGTEMEPPATGMLTRHGCPNLARWYDDMGLGLGFHDSSVHRDTPGQQAVPAAAKKRACDRILAELARWQGPRRGAALAGTAGGLESVGEFCQQHGLDVVAGSWLVPLAASVWCVSPARVREMDALTVFRRLFENGLLVPGGDGSGSEPSAWWQLQPRGGMLAVQQRSVAHLLAIGVKVMRVQHLSTQVQIDYHDARTFGGSVSVQVAGAELQVPFRHLILATNAQSAVQLLRSCNPEASELRRALQKFSDRVCSSDVSWERSEELVQKFAPTAACCVVTDCDANAGKWDASQPFAVWRAGKLCLESYEQHSVPAGHTKDKDGTVELTMRAVAAVGRQKESKGRSAAGSAVESKMVLSPTLITPEIARQQQSLQDRQGLGGVWCVGAFQSDGLQEGALASALSAVRALLSVRNIPLATPACRFKLHQRWSGYTTHRRAGPRTHSFKYNIRHDLVNVDAGLHRWWGGLYRADHFGDPSVDLAETIRQRVCEETGEWAVGPVDFLGTLREWGYCFNPICLFICWSDVTRARVEHVVSVVTNTPWGQRSIHVLPLTAAHQDGGLKSTTQAQKEEQPEARPSYSIKKPKVLHVSPFNPTPNGISCWNYKMIPPTQQLDKMSLIVQSYADSAMNDLVISASMILQRQEATEQCCLRHCNFSGLRGPYALLVQFRIHWQAVLLYRRGLTFYANTSCPYANVMHGSISHPLMAVLLLVAIAVGTLFAQAVFWLLSTVTAASSL